jgi:triosephosphate isomerase
MYSLEFIYIRWHYNRSEYNPYLSLTPIRPYVISNCLIYLKVIMPNIFLTAQNIDVYTGDGFDPYARTGCVTAQQIYRAGADGVILGHSETNDTKDQVRGKLLSITQENNDRDVQFLENITVLVGESWGTFSAQNIHDLARSVADDLSYILKDIPMTYISKLVVGYEPKWGSRGSGRDDMPPPQPNTISVL